MKQGPGQMPCCHAAPTSRGEEVPVWLCHGVTSIWMWVSLQLCAVGAHMKYHSNTMPDQAP